MIIFSIENRIEKLREDTYIAQPYDLEVNGYLFASQIILMKN